MAKEIRDVQLAIYRRESFPRGSSRYHFARGERVTWRQVVRKARVYLKSGAEWANILIFYADGSCKTIPFHASQF